MRRLKLIILAILFLHFMAFATSERDVDVLTTAQNLTTSWVDLGSEIDCRDYRWIHIYITIDINNGANVRLRGLSKHESGGTEEYIDAIYTEGSSDVKVEADYREFNVDEDKLYHLIYDTKNGVQYLQLQVQAGTAGAPTAAQIDACYANRRK